MLSARTKICLEDDPGRHYISLAMTSSTAVPTHCLDASALVEHYISEKGSDALKEDPKVGDGV